MTKDEAAHRKECIIYGLLVIDTDFEDVFLYKLF